MLNLKKNNQKKDKKDNTERPQVSTKKDESLEQRAKPYELAVKQKRQQLNDYLKNAATKRAAREKAGEKSTSYAGANVGGKKNTFGSTYGIDQYKRATEVRSKLGQQGAFDSGKDYRYQTDTGLQKNIDKLSGQAESKRNELKGLEEKYNNQEKYKPEDSWAKLFDWTYDFDTKNEQNVLARKDLGKEYIDNANNTLARLQAGRDKNRQIAIENAQQFGTDNPKGIYKDDDDDAMRAYLREETYNRIMPEQYADRVKKLNAEQRKEFDRMIDEAILGVQNPYSANYEEEAQRLMREADAYDQQLRKAQAEQTFRKDMDDWRMYADKLQEDIAYNSALIPEPSRLSDERVGYVWEPKGSETEKAYFWVNNPHILGGYENSIDYANKYMFMTDEQRDMFNEFFAYDKKNNSNLADSFLKGLDNFLQTSLSEYQDYAIRYKAEQPVTGALIRGMTYPLNVVNSGLSMLGTGMALLGNKDAQDPNSKLYLPTKIIRGTREQQNENIDKWATDTFGPWAEGKANFLLGVVDSIGDNLFAMGTANAMTGDTDKAMRLVQGIMSGSATGNRMLEGLENNLDPTEAAIRAVGDGVIEWFTERVSLEEFLKPNVREMLGNKKQLAKYLAKVTAAEGSEEINSDLLNMGLDYIVSMAYGHENELEQKYNELVADGMDGTQAWKQVLGDKFHEIGMSGLAGAMSGGLMGAGRIASNAISERSIGKQVRANVSEEDGGRDPIRSLVDAGLKMDADTQTAQLAKELDETLKSGKDISNTQIGKLVQNIQVDTNEQIGMIAKDTLEDHIYQELNGKDLGGENQREVAKAIAQAIAKGGINNMPKGMRDRISRSSDAIKAYMSYLTDTETRGSAIAAMEVATRGQRDAQRSVAEAMMPMMTKDVRGVDMESVKEQMATEEEIKTATGTPVTGSRAVIIDGKHGKLLGLEKTKNGIMYAIETADGKVHKDAADIRTTDVGTAAVVRAQAENPGMFSRWFTNDLLQEVERGKIKDAGRLIEDAAKIRMAAYTGATMPQTSLSEETAKRLYDDSADEYAQTRKTETSKDNRNAGKPGTGSTTFHGAKYGTAEWDKATKNLSKTQRGRMNAYAEVAKRAGIELTFVDNDEVPELEEDYKDQPGSFYGSERKSGIRINIEGEEYGLDENGKRVVVAQHHMGVAFGHEMTHFLQRNSLEGYNRLERYVFETLRNQRGQRNVEQRIQEKMQNQNLDIADAMSEIVADSCDQILANENVMKHIQETDQGLYGTIKGFVRNLVERLKSAARGMDMSASRDARRLFGYGNELAKIWLGAYDEVLSGAGLVEDIEGNDEERYSKAEETYKFAPDFENNIKLFKTDYNAFKAKNVDSEIVIGETFQILQDIGIANKPLVIDQNHLHKGLDDNAMPNHKMSPDELMEIIRKANNPVAIIKSRAQGMENNSIVLIVDHKLHDSIVMVPIRVSTEALVNSIRIDANRMASAHSRSNMINLLKDAVNTELSGTKPGIYYVNKNKADFLRREGVQFPSSSKNNGLMHKITENPDFVKQSVKHPRETANEMSKIRKSTAEIDQDEEDLTQRLQDAREKERELRARLKELTNSEEYNALAEELYNAQSRDERKTAAANIRAWEQENGIKELQDEIYSAEEERKTAQKEWDAYIEARDLREEQAKIEKSGLSEADWRRKEAVKAFGYTTNFKEAGYMLPNGKMLNFSGEKGRHTGTRGEDHRGIGITYATKQGSAAMNAFMADGNIRVMAETPGIDITVEPTKEQYAQIRAMARTFAGEEYFNVDFSDERGNNIDSIEYDGRVDPARVVNDIKTFFRTGEAPQQSVVSQFHYSQAEINRTYEEAFANNDEEQGAKLVAEAGKKAGYTIRAFHGTSRGDRVGNVFRPERATSGPMAFFTDNRQIAENYAKDKADTSIAYDETYGDYFTQFRAKNKRGKDIPAGELWKEMSYRDRQRVMEAAKHINWDDEMENIIYDQNAKNGNGGFQDWLIREKNGNAIDALIEVWLNGGDLYNQEERFLDVLKLAGIENVTWNDPYARHEKVYDTYLRIQNPFRTKDMYTEEFLQGLEDWWDEQDQEPYERETANADPWDKNNRSVEQWAEQARRDIESGRTTAWTSIPDAITDFLKSQGYDGIQDTGGKNGGLEHTVWIPFSSEQVKSAVPFEKDDKGNLIPLNKRFNGKKNDIRYSHADPEVRKYLSDWAKNHVQENYDLRDEILAKYGMKPGELTMREGSKMSKKDRQTLQAIDREIEKWEQKQIDAMGLDESDLGAQYVLAWKHNNQEKMEEILMEKLAGTEGVIPYKAPVWYDSDRHRQIANMLKEKNLEAIMYASVEMAALVPKNAVLVPMPPHTGKVTDDTDTMALARAISELTGRPVINALEGAERAKRKETKTAGGKMEAEQLGFRQVAEIPQGMIPYFIDNVVGSGVTAQAAHDAIGYGITLAYAKSTRAAIDGLKNADNTFTDKYQMNLIPLDARFDMEKTGVKGTRYSSAEEFSADVNAWMSNISVSTLQTEDERQLWQAWKGKRLEIQLSLKKQMDYKAKLKRLQEAQNLTAAERDEMRGLENKIEIQMQKHDRLEEEMYQITSSQGYAGMMYQNNKILQDFIYGRTQEQVRESVDRMMDQVERAQKEIEKYTKELDKLAKTEAVTRLRQMMKDTSLGYMATMLKGEYSSSMRETEIASRLAEMALRQMRGEDVTEDVEQLAQDLVSKMRGMSGNETLDMLRGRTFTIGEEDLKQLKAENSNMREIRSRLKGSGVKIVVGDKSRLQEQWNELRENDQSLPDIDGIAEIDKVHEVVDFIESLMKNNNGGEQFGVDMDEVRGMVQAATASVTSYLTGDENARNEIRGLIEKKRAGQIGSLADSMEQIGSRMKDMISSGAKAKNWVNVLETDVESALNYYNTTARAAAEEERNRVRKQLLEKLRNEHTRDLMQQRDKYEKKMKEDRKLRALAQDNRILRSRIGTFVKRLGRLITQETDIKNIPEEAKPLARIMLRMIARNDYNGHQRLTHIPKEQLETLLNTLDTLERRDGAFKQEDLDWLVTGEGPNADYEVRDKAAMDLQKIESGIVTYLSSEGMGAITLQDRKNALSQIRDAVNEIYDIIQARREVEIKGKKMLAEELALQAQDEMANSRFKGEFVGAIGKRIGKLRGFAVIGNMTPEYFFKNLRNKTLSQLYGEYHDAENRAGLEYGKAKRRIETIAKETGYSTWDLEKKHTLNLKKGTTVQLNLEQMMQLYATWKREEALQSGVTDTEKTYHLSVGGFYVENDESHKIAGREVFKQRAYRMMPEDFQTLSDMLTNEQKEYVERIVSYMSNEMSDLGNDASMRMYGIKKYNEKYYFPFEVWSGVKAIKSDAGVGGSKESHRGAHPGFSNRLRNNASNALMIRGFTQTATKHVVGMINYNTFAPAIEFMQRVMNTQVASTEGDDITKRNLWAAFGEAYGRDAMDYFRKFQDDINGGATRAEKTVFDKLLSTFRKSAVAGSMSVALQQPLSYIRAGILIDPKYLAAALPKQLKGAAAEMEKWSGVAVLKKMGKFDMGIGASAQQFIRPEEKTGKGRAAYEWLSEKATILPEMMDQATWTRIWVACKLEQLAQHPNMDPKSDEFMRTVAERFNEVLRQTQVYDSTLVRSQNMRSTNPWMKSLTSFMAEPSLTANVLADAVANAKEKGGKLKLARAAAAFVLSAVAQAIVKGIVGAGRNPDKKKTWDENAAYRFMYSFISEINPLSLLPGYSDLITAMKDEEVADDAMSTIGKILQIGKKMTALVQGKSEDVYRDVEDSVGLVAQLFTDIPVKNLARDARAMYNFFTQPYAKRETSAGVLKYQTMDLMMTADNLIGVINEITGKGLYNTTNTAYYRRLFEADKSGDEKKRQQLWDFLTLGKGVKESDINEKLRKFTREDEDLSSQEKLEKQKEFGLQSGNSFVLDEYEKGNLTRKEAEKLYRQEMPNASDKDVLKVFDAKDWKNAGNDATNYSNYTPLYAAIETNRIDQVRSAVKYLTDNGYEIGTIKSTITKKYKADYLAATGKKKDQMRLQLITAYKALGMTEQEAIDTINGWKKK